MLVPLLAFLTATASSAEVFPSVPRYVRSIGGMGRPGVFSWGVQYNPVTNEMLVADYLHFVVRRYDMNGNHLGDFWRPEGTGLRPALHDRRSTPMTVRSTWPS